MKKVTAFVLCLLMLLASAVAVSAEETEISKGAKYDLITPASESYPDDGKLLTDGDYGTHVEGTDGYYASGRYVGFNKADINDSGNFALILDLGEVKENITGLTVGYLSETAVGIHAPESVTFAISDVRNGDYKTLGVLETTPENTTVSATYAKTLSANTSGRYVLVTITPAGYTGKVDTESVAPWTFIDEIAVHAGDSNGENPDGETSDGENNDDNNENNGENDGSQISTPDEDNKDNENDTPQTGDTSTILGFVFLGLSATAMAIALFVKKGREQF